MLFALSSCNKSIGKADKDAAVSYNGSLMVTQGAYVYFVNGMTEQTADNKNGDVVKGAIYRAKIDGSGNISDVKALVKQAYFTSYTGAGLYVFGEWLYYVTPNTAKDKNGTLLSDQTLVMRVKTDGTKSQKIATLKIAAGFTYKITASSFYYLDGTDLKSIDLSKNNFKTKVIAEEVASFVVPKASSYSPNGNPSIYDYVVYTKSADEAKTGMTVNEVLATNGSDTKTLIGKSAYFNESSWENDINNLRIFTVSSAAYDGTDLVVYTSRKSTGPAGEIEEGAFAYKFYESAGYALNLDNVWHLATTAPSSYQSLGFGRGILVSENSAVNYYAGMLEKESKNITKDKKINEPAFLPIKVFNAEANILTLNQVGETQYVMYFTPSTSNGALQKAKIDLIGNEVDPYDADEFRPLSDGHITVLVQSDVVVSWIAPFFRDYNGTQYCYFIYAKNYNYLYRASTETAEGVYISESKDGVNVFLIGVMNDADKTTYDARIKAEEEAAAK
jgi:hypothetical protein